MSKFLSSYCIAFVSFLITALAIAILWPSPAQAREKIRLSYEDRAVLEQKDVLDGAVVQGVALIDSSRYLCEYAGGKWKGGRVDIDGRSRISNRIKKTDDHKLFSVRGGRATFRPMNIFRRGIPNDYRNDAHLDVDTGGACVEPRERR